MRSLDGYSFCTVLDLDMGYWTFALSRSAQKLCTIVLPWGKYCYKRLPMGLSVAPDVYQERMAQIFADMPHIRVYLDDILIITSGDFSHHLETLRQVLQRLRAHNLQIHADKSSFCALETEYLGFILTPNGIRPQTSKVQAILNLAPPTTVKHKSEDFLVW